MTEDVKVELDFKIKLTRLLQKYLKKGLGLGKATGILVDEANFVIEEGNDVLMKEMDR